MTWSHGIGFRWASWRIRRHDLFTVDIRTALSHGGAALVFLPDDEEFLGASLGACRELAAWFHPIHVMALSISEQAPSLPAAGCPALSVPNAINRWGLPYRPVIRRVAEIAPQAAFSLYPEFHLASAYLCVACGAPLRIGLGVQGDGYFNLRYVWHEASDLHASDLYRGFLRMLADLRFPASA